MKYYSVFPNQVSHTRNARGIERSCAVQMLFFLENYFYKQFDFGFDSSMKLLRLTSRVICMDSHFNFSTIYIIDTFLYSKIYYI